MEGADSCYRITKINRGIVVSLDFRRGGWEDGDRVKSESSRVRTECRNQGIDQGERGSNGG